MKILAIETSCDDTGIAILEIFGDRKAPDFKILSNIVSSQTEVHKKYGGVYPAMAKREHQKNLALVLIKALKKANNLKFKIQKSKTISNLKFKKLENILEREPELLKKIVLFLKKYEKPDVDLVAVTNGPGLEPCLWVGVNFAKALSYFWDIPVVPVNHIEGHILVNLLPFNIRSCVERRRKFLFPAICLVASGGHTQLILMKKIGDYKILGETRDDAAGECFDKCAKILGLGYPGGPAIAKLSSQWKSEIRSTKSEINSKLEIQNSKLVAILPRPMINTKDYDFSFSGLKTAVLYHHKKQVWLNSHDRRKLTTLKLKQYRKEMAAEIQQVIIDVLIKKTMKAVKDYKAKTIILGGGVSANQELRKQFARHCEQQRSNLNLIFPKPDLSTDNGLMTAIAGYFHKKEMINPSAGSGRFLRKIEADGNLRIG